MSPQLYDPNKQPEKDSFLDKHAWWIGILLGVALFAFWSLS